MGLMALATPILYLYLLLAGPGPAEAVMAVLPVTPLLVVVAVASFLLGWVTITTLSFPHSLDVPLRGGESWKYLRGLKEETVRLARLAGEMPRLGLSLVGRWESSGYVDK
jgi:hypothetical protein